MSRKIKLVTTASLALALSVGSAGTASALSGPEKLQKILNTHLYRGGVVTPDIRAATGNPDIPVIDRRIFGEFSSCSYRFVEGRFKGRILVCE